MGSNRGCCVSGSNSSCTAVRSLLLVVLVMLMSLKSGGGVGRDSGSKIDECSAGCVEDRRIGGGVVSS